MFAKHEFTDFPDCTEVEVENEISDKNGWASLAIVTTSSNVLFLTEKWICSFKFMRIIPQNLSILILFRAIESMISGNAF